MPELNGTLKNVLTHKATKWSGVIAALLAIGGGYMEQRTHADSTSSNVDSLGVELMHVIADVNENKIEIIGRRSADSAQNAILERLTIGQETLGDKIDALAGVVGVASDKTNDRFDRFIDYMLAKEKDSAFTNGGG